MLHEKSDINLNENMANTVASPNSMKHYKFNENEAKKHR